MNATARRRRASRLATLKAAQAAFTAQGGTIIQFGASPVAFGTVSLTAADWDLIKAEEEGRLDMKAIAAREAASRAVWAARACLLG